MTTWRFLDIAPLDTLPPTTPDTFTYFSSTAVEPGALVKIQFRQNIKLGYVIASQEFKRAAAKQLPFNPKPIQAVVNPCLSVTAIQKQLMPWLSRYANLSLGHAWFLCLQPLIKANLIEEQQLTKISLTPKRGQKFSKIYQRQLEPDRLTPPTLIIVPSEDYFQSLQQQLAPHLTTVIDFSWPSKKLATVIRKILNRDQAIYIGTKQSVFLPWLDLKALCIYREGSPLFKDYFKPPYLNYTAVIEKLAELIRLPLYIIDDLPSLKIQTEQRLQPPPIEFKTFFGLETLGEKLQNYKRSIIIIHQKAAALKLLCAACYQTINCPDCNWPFSFADKKLFCRSCFQTANLPTTCPNCNNKDFSLRHIGGEWLNHYLTKLGFPVVFLQNKHDHKRLNQLKNFIVIGSLNTILEQLPPSESAFLLDFDRAFHSFDLFLKERLVRALVRLQPIAAECYVESQLDDQLLNQIRTGELWQMIKQERQANFLPPYSRLTRITQSLSNLQQLNQRMISLRQELETRRSQFKERIELAGPFLHNLPKRRSRYQLDLLIKAEPSLNLRKFLEKVEAEKIEVDCERT